MTQQLSTTQSPWRILMQHTLPILRVMVSPGFRAKSVWGNLAAAPSSSAVLVPSLDLHSAMTLMSLTSSAMVAQMDLVMICTTCTTQHEWHAVCGLTCMILSASLRHNSCHGRLIQLPYRWLAECTSSMVWWSQYPVCNHRMDMRWLQPTSQDCFVHSLTIG